MSKKTERKESKIRHRNNEAKNPQLEANRKQMRKALHAHGKHHKKSKFQIITMVAVWAMIISTVGALVLQAVVSLAQNQ